MKKIISIAIGKGGVGKTTTATNLATCLAVAEKKTLLIDFDPSGSCSDCFGFSYERPVGGIFKVLSFTRNIDQVVQKTDLENLDFIPSDITSPEIEDRMLKLTNYSYLFNNILSSYELAEYEYIIIDCPPYLKGLTTIALNASTSVLIPVKAGQYSILALRKMFDYYNWIKKRNNPNLKIEGILRTIYEPDTKAWSLTNNELYDNYMPHLFKTVIPKNITLTESEFYKRPAILFNLKSKGSQAYLRLTEEILSKNSEQYNPQNFYNIPVSI